jgi:hypothetical protein
MHINKIIDFWYDVLPTVTASLTVLVTFILDICRKRNVSK